MMLKICVGQADVWTLLCRENCALLLPTHLLLEASAVGGDCRCSSLCQRDQSVDEVVVPGCSCLLGARGRILSVPESQSV